MWIQYVQEVLVYHQLNNMWPEIIVVIVVCVTIAFFIVRWLDNKSLKKLKRGYDKKDDPGREIETTKGMGYRGSEKDSSRKSKLQDALKHAKRELLSNGDSGEPDSSIKSIGETNLNHRY